MTKSSNQLSKRQCRRSAFFRHFTEPLQDCNGMCDNCASLNEVTEIDVSRHANIMISLLQDMQKNDQRVTMLQLVEKIKVKHKEIGSDLKREEIEQLLIQLILDRVLKEEYQHTAYTTNAYVTIGPLAKQVLQGKMIVKLEISEGLKSNGVNIRPAKRSLESSGLEFKLDELRKELSSIHGGIFPHSVLSTQQISMISSQKPNSVEQLENIIGKLKTEKYGCRILEEIANYTESKQPEPDVDMSNNGQSSNDRATKRPKTKKALVLIESSEDEA